jgi:hypothetical protein
MRVILSPQTAEETTPTPANLRYQARPAAILIGPGGGSRVPYRARHSLVGSQARKRRERHMSLLTYLCCSDGTLGFETEIDAGARVPSCDFPFGFAAAALPLTFVS